MDKKEIIEVRGTIDAFTETREASITVFEENDTFIDEKEYDIIELLEQFDGKEVIIRIEHDSEGVE